MKHVLLGSVLFYAASVCAQNNVVWSIGENDNSPSELALAPDGYKQFLANDFGYEDRYFLIGKSEAKKDFPYILPGPADEWGGTWSTSGWRTHDINILFNLKDKPDKGAWMLVVDLYDTQQEKAPKFKVTVNNQSFVYDLTIGGGCAD
ncbi:MAG: polysaccharide lyase family protein, partial [Tannerellaceae bacterium]